MWIRNTCVYMSGSGEKGKGRGLFPIYIYVHGTFHFRYRQRRRTEPFVLALFTEQCNAQLSPAKRIYTYIPRYINNNPRRETSSMSSSLLLPDIWLREAWKSRKYNPSSIVDMKRFLTTQFTGSSPMHTTPLMLM